MDMINNINSNKNIIGFILIVIGIIGIIIPLLPGIPIIILGISILGWDTIKEKVESLKNEIQKNNLENKSSILIKLYLIPLEWIILLEKNKNKNKKIR